MKSKQYPLIEWYTETAVKDLLDINWDLVKTHIGADHIDWLNNRPKTKCQIIYEQSHKISRLIAEFYDEHTELEYCLKWAK